MSRVNNVLERAVIQQGKVFIKAGEENSRAYVIQNGKVCAYAVQDDGEKVVVSVFGPGTIIGEMGLMLDEAINLNYEAIETTTVVTVTRQDFQKRLSKTDKTIKTILDHAIKKIESYEKMHAAKAFDNAQIDHTARALVKGLLNGLSEDKKHAYEQALLPHINGLIKEIQNLKSKK